MGENVYTIGCVSSYDHALSESKKTGEPVLKLGRTDPDDPDYEGGWVWRDYGKAREVAAEATTAEGHLFDVYEVELVAPWNECVSLGRDGEHHTILDAKILRRVIPLV